MGEPQGRVAVFSACLKEAFVQTDGNKLDLPYAGTATACRTRRRVARGSDGDAPGGICEYYFSKGILVFTL